MGGAEGIYKCCVEGKSELLLQSRVPRLCETVLAYVKEMKFLFSVKKVEILVKGVKELPFNNIVRSPPRTIVKFISDASMIEKTLDTRARQLELLLHVFPVSHFDFSKQR